MVTVAKKPHESFEALLKRFRKRTQEAKIRSQVRKRRFFEKPSQERKRKARRKLVKSRKTTYKDVNRRY